MADIIEHMPLSYKESQAVKDITAPMDLENATAEISIADYVNQFVVANATWALDRYEEQYALPINPQGITLEERRSRIKAKMRSVGVVNSAMIKNVVNAWTNGIVDIIEDYNNYTVTIKFTSIVGIPTNMQDVYNAIDLIKPSHLMFKYEFLYLTWDKLDSYNLNFNQIDALNKTWDQWQEYVIL